MGTRNETRGRDAFQRYERLLQGVERLVAMIPKKWRASILDGSRHIPSRLGIALRYVLLRATACECGRLVAVFDGVHLKSVESLSLGSHVSIHPMSYLDATGGIRIGSNVSIAHSVTIMSTEHKYDQSEHFIRDAPLSLLPVEIGDDVWLGAGVKVLAGVNIGSHVVVGAGAVVTRDIPSDSVAVGIPARVIKQLARKS